MSRSEEVSVKEIALVISDDAETVAGIKQAFAMSLPQMQVRTAGSKQDIANLVIILCPQIIILDLYMQNIDGFELLRTIRQHTSSPVITMSYARDESTLVDVLNLGADGHMTKPLRLLELIARVRACLRRSYPTGNLQSRRSKNNNVSNTAVTRPCRGKPGCRGFSGITTGLDMLTSPSRVLQPWA